MATIAWIQNIWRSAVTMAVKLQQTRPVNQCGYLGVVVFLCAMFSSPTAFAISVEGLATDTLDFLADHGVLKKNEVEMLKFSIKRPACADTIFNATVSQDYSLIATVVGMKAAKVGGQVKIDGLKSFDQNMCKKLSPLEQFYTLVDRTADKVIQNNSSSLKAYAKQQIDQGKTELEGQLSGYSGFGVLQNWSCLCDAAFETNLTEEKLAASGYVSGKKIVNAAYSGNIGTVIEVILTEFGPLIACQMSTSFSSGVLDVCGLIDELVNLAEDALDPVKAFINWAGEAISDAACYVGLGGCDSDPPPPPPELVIYNEIFAPKIQEGLNAIEAVDAGKFSALIQQLQNLAYKKYDPYLVKLAATMYNDAVNKQWDRDITTKVITVLGKKRDQYNTPQQVKVLAKAAADVNKQNNNSPKYQIIAQCENDFAKKFAYAHVDRWINQNQELVAKLVQLKIVSNRNWCEQTFYAKNIDTIKLHFFNYAKDNYCPASGYKLYCASLKNYELCAGLMGSVGQTNVCDFNVTAMGLDIAEKIQAEFYKKLSTIACQTKVNEELKSKPVDFICERPTQGYHCNQFYKKFNLPKKVLTCVVIEKPAYTQLKSRVADVAKQLSDTYNLPYGIDNIDPLLIESSQAGYNKVKADSKQDFKFPEPSKNKGFDYYSPSAPRLIDGLTTPGLLYAPKLITTGSQVSLDNSIGDKVKLVKPGDPDPLLTPGGKPGRATAIQGTAPVLNSQLTQPLDKGTTPMVLPPATTKSAKDPSGKSGTVTFGGKVAGIKQATGMVGQPTAAATARPSMQARSTAQRQTSRATQQPDLVINRARTSVIKDCNSKQAVQVNVRIQNTGKGAFPALKGKPVLFIKADNGVQEMGIELAAIAPGKYTDKQLTLVAEKQPAALAGKTITLEVQLNKDKWVTESNHGNNTRKLSVRFPTDYCQAVPGRAVQTPTQSPRDATRSTQPAPARRSP